MSLVTFLASTRGRVLRAVIGLAMIGLGWFFLWYHGGIIIALAGLLLVLAAVNDVCLLAWLYNRPIAGDWLRAAQDNNHYPPLRHSH